MYVSSAVSYFDGCAQISTQPPPPPRFIFVGLISEKHYKIHFSSLLDVNCCNFFLWKVMVAFLKWDSLDDVCGQQMQPRGAAFEKEAI